MTRTFSLDGWQWRKYKTRDGRDAKIVEVIEKSVQEKPVVARIYDSEWGDYFVLLNFNGTWGNNKIDDKHDLFDISDQKEPECGYIYYESDGTLGIPAIITGNDKYYEEHYKNRIKVYLEKGRWDT